MTKTTKTTRSTKSSKAPKVAPRKSLAHHAAHHAKRVYHITPRFVHGMLAGAFLGTLIIATMTVVSPASALSMTSTRDCTANAVLNCGALSTDELKQKYPQAGAATIYNYYGINSTDVANMGTTAVVGQTTKDGKVMVNGKVVAVDASSAGRQKINGSHSIVFGGMTFYETPNQAAFRSNSINVFVVMKNGAFDFAIMGACGNPVIATPTTKPTPPPVTPTTPKPTPPPVTPVTPTPPVKPPTPVTPMPPVTPVTPATPKPTPPTPPVETPITPPNSLVITPVASEKPVELPKTGPGPIITIAVLSVAGGYVFHMQQRRRKLKRHEAYVAGKAKLHPRKHAR